LIRAAFALVVWLACVASQAATLSGRVVAVADGDTITVLDAARNQHRIRLAGIDAPEKRQPFGQRSKDNLAALVFDKTVRVEWQKTDRYRRKIGKVFTGEREANLEQIRAGLAWWYRDYAVEQSAGDRQRYSRLEIEAKRAGRGLWSELEPTAPWEYRRARRAPRSAPSADDPIRTPGIWM
jgi:endonuclease YncB( thermonuclease family)